MKKLLLLQLLLLLSFTIYSQPPGMYPPYAICDDSSNDGFAVFNLNSTLPTILNGLDASIHEVHFYPSDTDSANSTNEIIAPAAYTNVIQGTQTLGIRIFNTSTNETHLAGMNIIVNSLPIALITGTTSICQNSANPQITFLGANGTAPYTFSYTVNGVLQTLSTSFGNTVTVSVPTSTIGSSVYSLISVQSSGVQACSQNQSGLAVVTVNPTPVANPASLYFCEGFALVMYNLPDADNEITGGSVGNTVTYYETLVDAQTGANPIGPTYTPTNSGPNGQQILFARVQNQAAGCFSTTTLTLNTNNCGTSCPMPTNLNATNVTDTSFTLNWTNPNGSLGMIYSTIVIVPLGAPPTVSNAFSVIGTANTFIITDLQPDACYSAYVRRNCSTTSGAESDWSAPLNICMSDCANSSACSEVLILNAYVDSNNNGIKDVGEPNFNTGNFVYQINDSGNNLFGTTNQGSYYIFESNPANSYDISFAINPELSNYYASAATYSNVTLPNGSGNTFLYFPVTSTQPYTDARALLYNLNNPRPGFIYTMHINYSNLGLDTIANGTLTFSKDPNLTISSVNQAGIVNTANGFTYSFTNLAPNEYRSIQVNLLVPVIPAVAIGQLVTNSVSIQTNNDSNSSNNEASYTQAIVGSYDPNDKSESHGGKIGLDNFTDNDYLYYTICFENTGTASTEFIRIEDVLDSQLDQNTFQMLATSHPANIQRNGSQLTWHFYNTQIPPTSVDPINSHGYVYFRIKPKMGYATGDIIPNTASIYFDYNPPIVTNTFNTELFDTLGNTTFNANSISMYPNPTSNLVTITNTNSAEKVSKVTIYDITGKRIYSLNNSLDTIKIDVSVFSKGMYLVELSSGSSSKVTKKLILK
jgi:hypothetical protein